MFCLDDFRVRFFASTSIEKFHVTSLPYYLDIANQNIHTEWVHHNTCADNIQLGLEIKTENKRNSVTLAKTLKEKGGMYFISNTQLHLLPFKYL